MGRCYTGPILCVMMRRKWKLKRAQGRCSPWNVLDDSYNHQQKLMPGTIDWPMAVVLLIPWLVVWLVLTDWFLQALGSWIILRMICENHAQSYPKYAQVIHNRSQSIRTSDWALYIHHTSHNKKLVLTTLNGMAPFSVNEISSISYGIIITIWQVISVLTPLSVGSMLAMLII